MRTIYKCLTCKTIIDDQITPLEKKDFTIHSRLKGDRVENLPICPTCEEKLEKVTVLR